MDGVSALRALAAVVAMSVVVAGCTPAEDAEWAAHRPGPLATADASPAAVEDPPEETDGDPTAGATPSPSSAPKPRPKPKATGSPGPALAALATLAVKGRAPMTGYDRDRFGPAWLDANRNGCDTRNDILARDLVRPTFKPDTHGCVVTAGQLDDGYTGDRIAFVKGADLVDIDHVVALGNAWATGAFGWPIKKRAALANDPLNLQATDSGANRSKADGDAATWLPPNRRHRCAYVARQVAVKAKYGLWVTRPEKEAVTRVLAACPGQRLPQDSGAPVLAPVNVREPTRAPGPRPAPKATRKPQPLAAPQVYYENCTAVRDADADPIRVGDPGYGDHLDRDGDGVACE